MEGDWQLTSRTQSYHLKLQRQIPSAATAKASASALGCFRVRRRTRGGRARAGGRRRGSDRVVLVHLFQPRYFDLPYGMLKMFGASCNERRGGGDNCNFRRWILALSIWEGPTQFEDYYCWYYSSQVEDLWRISIEFSFTLLCRAYFARFTNSWLEINNPGRPAKWQQLNFTFGCWYLIKVEVSYLR